jgi:hypothetical protein
MFETVWQEWSGKKETEISDGFAPTRRTRARRPVLPKLPTSFITEIIAAIRGPAPSAVL